MHFFHLLHVHVYLPAFPLALALALGVMGSHSSDGSSSSDDSGSDSDQGFVKNVSFKRTRNLKSTDSVDNKVPDAKESIVCTVNKNLHILNSQLRHEKSVSYVSFDESVFCEVDDTDSANDDNELELWRKRELERLHRDRNVRISRE